jgi:type VI secretion system protein ImpI
MPLTLSIDNMARLPDGGPTSYRLTGRRGIDIGRDQHLDWTLPDPDRFVSGKHCEIRFREGAYWLHDVSSNGTFVNGSDRRLHEPHRLRNGDRLEIGQYIISVAIDGEEAGPPPRNDPPPPTADPSELWGVADDVAPPIAASDLRAPRRAAQAAHSDFLDWVVDVPDLQPGDPVFRPASRPLEPPATRQHQPQPFQPASAPDPYNASGGGAQPFAEPPPSPVPAPRRNAAPPADDVSWAEPAQSFASEPMSPPAHYAAEPAQSASAPPVASPEPSPSQGFAPSQPAFAPPQEAVPMPRADSELLARLAQGAGLPVEALRTGDPGELAEEVGVVLRLMTENLKQLLMARSETRAMVRSGRQTMIAAVDNNPLKFSPTAEDALRIMFGPRTRSYLDARQTVKQSFDDLKAHQINTYSAMQQAVRMLIEDLDPQEIDATVDQVRGLGAANKRKTKLWEAYVARWQAKAARHDNGLADAFMTYFSECYQRNANKIR